MRLLFLTQVIDADDAILGFVSRWIEGLARCTERVRVVALEAGNLSGLPDNVDVRVVGRRGVVRRYLRYRRILTEAFGRDGFDCVLAHMVPRYALVAAAPARRAGAGLFLWYTHKGVDERLRRAVELVDLVFTASEESLRVDTPRKRVTGHGIDLDHFDDRGEEPDTPPRLLAVGRLTRAKDPLTVLAAMRVLVECGRDVRLDFAGGALAAGDEELVAAVRSEAESGALAGRVRLLGEVPYPRIAELYRRASVLVNASLTGSVDKVVLEAMATRRPIVTCNESFPALLAPLGERAAELLFEPGDARGLAQRIEALLALLPADRVRLGEDLRTIVAEGHEVDRLMARLVEEMREACATRAEARA
jgi:glycosyltransferase involved in cell wall biosynthesis